MKQACFDKKNDTRQKSARTTLPTKSNHRTSDDEQGVYNHLLRKVFRFHYLSQKVIGSLGTSHVVPLHQSQLSAFFWGNPTKITIQTPWHQSTSIQTPDLLTGQQKSAKFQKFPPQKEKSGRKKSTTNNINIMKHLSQGFPYFVLSLGHGYSLTQSKNQRTNSRENQETWCMGWEFTPCMATPGFPWWATDVELRSCDKSRGPDIYS